jgi:hypothetical protein
MSGCLNPVKAWHASMLRRTGCDTHPPAFGDAPRFGFPSTGA